VSFERSRHKPLCVAELMLGDWRAAMPPGVFLALKDILDINKLTSGK